MKNFAINWKTTALGAAAIITIGAHWYATGTPPGAAEIGAALAAFGVVFAKDGNVSGTPPKAS